MTAWARTLLARVASALPRGGRVIIAEPMARTGRRDPQTAYFAAYFAAMQSGRLRSLPEIQALLREAGFGRHRTLSVTPLATTTTSQRV